jgi:hypothetical protein
MTIEKHPDGRASLSEEQEDGGWKKGGCEGAGRK